MAVLEPDKNRQDRVKFALNRVSELSPVDRELKCYRGGGPNY